MSNRKSLLNRDLNDNVTVAVRVRPFNARELTGRTRCIVSMNGSTTLVYNPFNSLDDPKAFTFDYSYWSHDRFVVRDDGYLEPARGSNYADQRKIFDDIGRRMVDQAWDGYNSAVFAYGQAGSGKSYTITGEEANAGLVPRTCEELFRKIDEHRDSDVSFEVTLNMLEIYNERVHDLLSSRLAPPGGLKVRGSVEHGFYVENLTSVVVKNIDEVEQYINEGNTKRTIAATKLNEASNRAHTIVTVVLTQTRNRQQLSLTATVNFVDLAGSERHQQTEASGDRFTESKNINLSLLTLANVISDLVDKRQKSTTRFRDSVLTKLLMNALGGNCKTTMIATISPDADNYEQTLSTLRYASRVKRLRTVPTVNRITAAQAAAAAAESHPVPALPLPDSGRSSQVKSTATKKSSATVHGYSETYVQSLKKKYELELQSYRNKVEELETQYRLKLTETERMLADKELRLSEKRKSEEVKVVVAKTPRNNDVTAPYLSNLNEDPSLTGKLRHLCKSGKACVGNDGRSDIILYGPGIVANHAEIFNDGGAVSLIARDGDVLHNGRMVQGGAVCKLVDEDRIRFGANNFFIFRNPLSPAPTHTAITTASSSSSSSDQQQKTPRVAGPSRAKTFTYEEAQQEIVRRSTIDIREAVKDDSALLAEVSAVLPLVHNVQAMAKEMNKPIEFTLVIVPPETRGLQPQDHGRPEVQVKVLNTKTGCKYMWTKEKFIVRQEYMNNMYEEFMETGRVPNWNKEHDPFWEPVDLEQIVGTVSVPLESLSRLETLPECRLSIVDYMANHCGELHVAISPCDKNGRPLQQTATQRRITSAQLIGRSTAFKLNILRATDLPPRFVKSWCEYRVLGHDGVKTRELDGNDPIYNHEQIIHIHQVDNEVLDYLSRKSLIIEVHGRQGQRSSSAPETDSKSREEAKSNVEELQRKLGAIRQLADSSS